MPLSIPAAQLEHIRREGAQAYPDECCGLLIGSAALERKNVLRILPVPNERLEAERFHRFLITPEVYLQGERSAQAEGLDVLGFYHSHPNAEARPSQYDLDHAWPWYSYVIVATTAAGPEQLTAWVLADDRSRFHPEPIEIKS